MGTSRRSNHSSAIISASLTVAAVTAATAQPSSSTAISTGIAMMSTLASTALNNITNNSTNGTAIANVAAEELNPYRLLTVAGGILLLSVGLGGGAWLLGKMLKFDLRNSVERTLAIERSSSTTEMTDSQRRRGNASAITDEEKNNLIAEHMTYDGSNGTGYQTDGFPTTSPTYSPSNLSS